MLYFQIAPTNTPGLFRVWVLFEGSLLLPVQVRLVSESTILETITGLAVDMCFRLTSRAFSTSIR